MMKSLFSACSVWLACVVLILAPATASAQTPAQSEARARQYYAEGTGHFQGGRYLEAEAAFAAGFELSHKPGFLWNMAECARLLGNRERALELYRRYVREAPSGAQRAEAEMHVRELEPSDDTAAKAHAPDRPSADPPATPPPQGPPLVLRLDGASAPKADSRHTASDVLKPAPERASAPVYQRWWFWTGAAAVVAGAVVTAVVISSSSGGGGGGGNPVPAGTTIDWRTP
ncbi:tetratricopeptide repeat protein [Pendulispora albinea]|uniref:Tetratricopeptide repeat protein n=1 Tax=Pendulispora albinea TaxID=2741071 RepID=A0ABZ2M7Z5_9BACT